MKTSKTPNLNLIWLIRLLSWSGICLSGFSIAIKSTDLFIISQLIAGLSSFFWCYWMQNKQITIDLVLSLGLAVLATLTKDPFYVYGSMWVRSIQYSLMFERNLRR